MDRLTLDETRIEELRDELRGYYPNNEKPIPVSALKVNDDVMWLGFIPMRVLWGHDHPDYFNAYSPDIFGDMTVNVEGQYITDRAPADSEETPMPIYPQQAQQPQGKKKHDAKDALKHLLKQLSPDAAKKVRALAKAKRPELLEGSP